MAVKKENAELEDRRKKRKLESVENGMKHCKTEFTDLVEIRQDSSREKEGEHTRMNKKKKHIEHEDYCTENGQDKSKYKNWQDDSKRIENEPDNSKNPENDPHFRKKKEKEDALIANGEECSAEKITNSLDLENEQHSGKEKKHPSVEQPPRVEENGKNQETKRSKLEREDSQSKRKRKHTKLEETSAGASVNNEQNGKQEEEEGSRLIKKSKHTNFPNEKGESSHSREKKKEENLKQVEDVCKENYSKKKKKKKQMKKHEEFSAENGLKKKKKNKSNKLEEEGSCSTGREAEKNGSEKKKKKKGDKRSTDEDSHLNQNDDREKAKNAEEDTSQGNTKLQEEKDDVCSTKEAEIDSSKAEDTVAGKFAKKKKSVRFGDVSVLGETENNDSEGSEKKDSEAKSEDEFSIEEDNEDDSHPVRRSRMGYVDSEGYVWGDWFSKEENDLLKSIILTYFEKQGWTPDYGVSKFVSKVPQEVWAECERKLPNRHILKIKRRASRIMSTGAGVDVGVKNGRWSKKEEDDLRDYFQKYGADWVQIGALLGRPAPHARQKYRHIRNYKRKGRWSLNELEILSSSVHEDMAKKAKEREELIDESKVDVLEKIDLRHNRKRLRDDIGWSGIADRLGTRPDHMCIQQWYNSLCSPMVLLGKWANTDDHNLLLNLLQSGATSEDEIEWDNLLKHRKGGKCLKRWIEMCKTLGDKGHESFEVKLEILIKRFAPCFLESEEKKPCVLEEKPLQKTASS